jgi:ABC-type transport system involved in multi-copper enzyme maturation permease subunit
VKELAFFVAREKARQPMVVAVGLAVLALAVVWAVYVDNPSDVLLMGGALLGFALGLGLVGLDFLHGSLQLLLARPITRNGYLAGKLLGAFFAGAGALLATGGVVAVVLVFKGRVGELGNAAAGLVAGLLSLAWFLVLFAAGGVLSSSHRSGDAFFFFLVVILPMVLKDLGKALDASWLSELAQWIIKNGFNPVQLEDWPPSTWPWRQILRWASNTALLASFSFWYFNKRELGYGRE